MRFSSAFCGSSISFVFEADSVDVLRGDVNKYICSPHIIPLITVNSQSYTRTLSLLYVPVFTDNARM